MSPAQATARRAGVLYFRFMIVALLGEYAFPAFMVSGDATATARNITAAEPAYRLAILTGLVTLVVFLFLVECLYQRFKDADQGQMEARASHDR